MKNPIIKTAFVLLLFLAYTACTEPDYFTATVSSTINSLTLTNGDELVVDKVEVTNATITHGDDGEPEAVKDYTIDHVDFFIGNVKVGQSSTKPYAFKHRINNLPAGTHEFRIDVLITHLPKRVWRDKDDSKYPVGNAKGKRRARISATYQLQITNNQDN